MKSCKLEIVTCAIGLLGLVMATGIATAQVTSAFTYQGELEQSGTPATGTYDLEFTLFEAQAGGTAFAGPVLVEDVLVDGGLFTTQVDFGAGVFGIMNLWLEVGVREGTSTGQFATLSPRQAVTPAPIAQHALNVEPGAVNMAQIATGAVGGDQLSDGGVKAVDVDETQVQLRIGTSCAPGSWIRSIGLDGTVICESDPGGDITAVTAGSGLTGGAASGEATLAADTSILQARVSGTCGPGQALTGVNTDGSVECAFTDAQFFLVDGTEFGVDHADVALRSDGRPVVSYFDSTSLDLKLFDCADTLCSIGTARSLDSAGNVGRYTSIAVRPGDLPIISYQDSSAADLKVYDCQSPSCDIGTARTVDAADDVGFDTSIAVRSTGRPIISHYDSTNDRLNVFDCDTTDCSSGTPRVPDPLTPGGDITSIAIVSGDLPIIAYREGTDLAVFACADSDCMSGASTTLDSSSGNFSDIAIRQGGLPIISYYRVTGQQLRVFDCSDVSCSAGTIRAPSAFGIGIHNSIAIGVNGNPVISYRTTDDELSLYRCADSGCSSGTFRTLFDEGVAHRTTSVLISADGSPLVVFPEQVNNSLNVLGCVDPLCDQ